MGKRISVASLGLVAAAAVALEAVSAAAAPSRPVCFGSKDIASPDATLVARIERGGTAGCGESRVAILDRRGRRLASKDFTSADGSHGEVVERAAWSKDSAAFVFSLSSSGGHEAQHFPIYVFSRRARSLRNVESLARELYVASRDFQITDDKLIVDDLNRGRRTVDLH